MRRPLLLFLLIALAQLAVPAWMIVKHERVIGQGEVFRFRTAPVDPRDPFRGEYVQLEFEVEQEVHPIDGPVQQDVEMIVYALMGTDEQGDARIEQVFRDPPEEGAFIRCIARRSSWDEELNGNAVRITLPFDRFYLQEGKGPRTEELLRGEWNEEERMEPLPAYAVVRVLNGEAVIEDLVVGDRSIQQWMNEDLP